MTGTPEVLFAHQEPIDFHIDEVSLLGQAIKTSEETGRLMRNAGIAIRRSMWRLMLMATVVDTAGFWERVELEVTWPAWRYALAYTGRRVRYRVGRDVDAILSPWNRFRSWTSRRIKAGKRRAARILRSQANRLDPPPSDLWDYGAGEGVGGIHVRMDMVLPPNAMMVENPAGGPPMYVTNIGGNDDAIDAMAMALHQERR